MLPDEAQNDPGFLKSVIDSSITAIAYLEAVRNSEDKIVDFRWIFQNARSKAHCGKRDMTGKLLLEENPSDDTPIAFEHFVAALEENHSHDFEVQRTVKDEKKWYRICATVLNDGIVSSEEDITGRKEAELEAEKQARLVEQVTNTIPDMVTVVETPSRNLIYANHKLYNGKEISPGALDADVKDSPVHPDDMPHLLNYFKRMEHSVNGDVETVDYRRQKDNGQQLWFNARGKVFERDENGKVKSFLNITRNITAQKAAEHAMIESNIRMSRLKLEQQKEILNAIISAQENERVRIGGALHDGVAQLLYAIQTRLQLLEVAERDKKTVDEIFEIVRDAITQTRNISFELVPVILNDYGLETALQELFKRIFDKQINLSFVFNADEELISDQLKTAAYRIVQELCNNLVRHAHASRAVVSISTDETSLVLRVSDNGKGFDVEQVKLQPTGIGLQNIRNRIALLGGTFEVHSRPGSTEISVQLPLSRLL